eukprot:CAMPEP_0184337826 /NCGR_PEP_ID=MMETSP1089-20130417/6279_1 /TAXON_ID=38269 ORGANISM="Gloeochaete wittrockiana, Strain SAG46.84" /NCGR_SAMPLE_ID=MMETSP1089 /ASSEMBLY_ACC=CAM_ASM_000445 /LENGTH=321 /DNA_ID=CAMNT_0026663887 /DNA_START=362 /DNA_END=1327 /DNA_ORIENTATION=-
MPSSSNTKESNWTRLHLAIVREDFDGFSSLLSSHPKLAHKATKSGATPLHLAAIEGLTDFVEMLLQYGAHVNAVDNSEQTPLHFAARNGSPDVVQQLLDAGAHIDATDEDNATALFWAVEAEQLEVVDVLVERGANRTVSHEERGSPLQMAVMDGMSDIIPSLLVSDSDFLQADGEGNNLAHLLIGSCVQSACSPDSNLETFKTLLRIAPKETLRALFSNRNDDGLSPLQMAHDLASVFPDSLHFGTFASLITDFSLSLFSRSPVSSLRLRLSHSKSLSSESVFLVSSSPSSPSPPLSPSSALPSPKKRSPFKVAEDSLAT